MNKFIIIILLFVCFSLSGQTYKVYWILQKETIEYIEVEDTKYHHTLRFVTQKDTLHKDFTDKDLAYQFYRKKQKEIWFQRYDGRNQFKETIIKTWIK